ncbi:biotin carboxyl carrier protein of acetyl-CoA carboxylase 1, chloroplastic isoform X4 [Ricinus communis]|uniref:biotin carboxyl carrier protein of acetyl-CoA carboxylase 1, chloroplastic isoform X4 n=1 Tax=Ricinus communis TaxID=3988 RepID=UPI00077231F4|nr:biotin carboxyl carrier protein of acetyl-CoA carboxylase 1, chloroplastic isoform X4 [Ricinus communis]|eukprot:XP_015572258.1 biotin carboxyl carrier protein of acetyl-CoA carboxylase 1, chloroplastic isoform X3 [Ricinus communis]
MASSLSTTPSASASAVVKTTPNLSHYSSYTLSRVSFPLSPKPNFRFFSQGQHPGRNSSSSVKAQLNEDPKDANPSNETSSPALVSEESISEFISQVASLVKLVDSRDIVELQLKQLDCELIIRKKEALPQPPSPAPVVMMHPPSPTPPPLMPMPPTSPAASSTASSPASSAPPPSSPSPPATKSPKSSHPPLKSPMAGTFYRSPAPGEPHFVKVGDKVQKGQVLCIIEAMKLMNEIEADQSGTIVEALLEDGKPVSVDTPLFVIEP